MAEFEEVYRLYFRDVYRYALSLCKNELLAEELTQETFFKALQSIDRFDGKCKLFVWLCQIAKNTYFTARQKSRRTGGEAELSQLPSSENFEERYLNQAEAFALHKKLHALEEPYKEVFSLRLFGELSFAQIADLFGKSESWARVTYHRARLKLKEDSL